MNQETINISFNVNAEDLICSICYSTVTTPLIHCHNSHHFVCLGCLSKSTKKCPICVTTRVFHDVLYFGLVIKCSHQGCCKFCFAWALEEHQSECFHKPEPCIFCNEMISLHSLRNHIKSACNVFWIDQTRERRTNSEAIDKHVSAISKGIKLDTIDIKRSIVIFYPKCIIFFIRKVHNWEIQILSEDAEEVDLAYFTPRTSRSFVSSTILTIKPSLKLNESEPCPCIPIEVLEVDVELSTSKDEDERRGGLEDFLQRLIVEGDENRDLH